MLLAKSYRSPDLLDSLLVRVPWQGREQRQPLVRQTLVNRDDHPVLGGVLDVARQLGVPGPGHRAVGELEPGQLIRNLIGHEGLDDDGSVNEHRVGHVERGRHTILLK